MKTCPFCGKEIEDGATVCQHCNRDLMRVGPTQARAVQRSESEHAAVAPTPIARVTIVDVNMPFASMVGFMVKWALAAIPAFLILAVLGALVAGLLAALVGRR